MPAMASSSALDWRSDSRRWQIGTWVLSDIQFLQKAIELPLALIFLTNQERVVTQLGSLLIFPLPLFSVVFPLLLILRHQSRETAWPYPYSNNQHPENDHQKSRTQARKQPWAPLSLCARHRGLFGNFGRGFLFRGFHCRILRKAFARDDAVSRTSDGVSRRSHVRMASFRLL